MSSCELSNSPHSLVQSQDHQNEEHEADEPGEEGPVQYGHVYSESFLPFPQKIGGTL